MLCIAPGHCMKAAELCWRYPRYLLRKSVLAKLSLPLPSCHWPTEKVTGCRVCTKRSGKELRTDSIISLFFFLVILTDFKSFLIFSPHFCNLKVCFWEGGGEEGESTNLLFFQKYFRSMNCLVNWEEDSKHLTVS